MFIPIRTDYRMRARPWANYALIAINIGVFFWTLKVLLISPWGWQVDFERIAPGMLQPNHLRFSQFFTSTFLHAGTRHLLGNMVFLWVFGNAINDRLGNVGYLAFYIAGGILAATGHLIVGGPNPALGASGAISAVTGAYLVLLPRTRVTLLMFFILILTFQVSSLWFLVIQFVFNLWATTDVIISGRPAGVAYAVHTAGYLFGMVVAGGLLVTGLLQRDVFDLLNLVTSARRRGRFRSMVREGYDPFGAGVPGRGARHTPVREVKSHLPDTQQARELQLRREIAEACRGHDVEAAAKRYMQLVQVADNVVLSQQNQLDVANYLMSDKQYAVAADAYERFIRHYASYPDLGDIYLMLGLIYGRYLDQYDRGEKVLGEAIARLSGEDKPAMARAELAALQAKRSGR